MHVLDAKLARQFTETTRKENRERVYIKNKNKIDLILSSIMFQIRDQTDLGIDCLVYRVKFSNVILDYVINKLQENNYKIVKKNSEMSDIITIYW